jgi:hypothetical protein
MRQGSLTHGKPEAIPFEALGLLYVRGLPFTRKDMGSVTWHLGCYNPADDGLAAFVEHMKAISVRMIPVPGAQWMADIYMLEPAALEAQQMDLQGLPDVDEWNVETLRKMIALVNGAVATNEQLLLRSCMVVPYE